MPTTRNRYKSLASAGVAAAALLMIPALPGKAQTVNRFAPGVLTWLIYGTDLYRINQAANVDPTISNATLTNLYFNNSKSYVSTVLSANSVNPPNAVRTWGGTSQTTMQKNLAEDAYVYNLGAVIYDNEAWTATPGNEQVDPAYYEQLMGMLAAALHLTFITSPSPTLSYNTASNTDPINTSLHPSLYQGGLTIAPSSNIATSQSATNYLELNLPGSAASAPSQIVNVALQGLLSNINATAYNRNNSTYLPIFTGAILDAVQEIHDPVYGNPSASVVVELSTGSGSVSLAQLQVAVLSTICSVDGYNIFIPAEAANAVGTPNATLAAQLLDWMYNTASPSC